MTRTALGGFLIGILAGVASFAGLLNLTPAERAWLKGKR